TEYFNFGKIFILILLSFSTWAFGGNVQEQINSKEYHTKEERNLQAKKYLENKYDFKENIKNEKQSLFEQILITIGAIVVFLIPILCPLFLVYLFAEYCKSNTNYRNLFSSFLIVFTFFKKIK
ncbi:hypothetical protein, partial [Helicobacter turcicus]